MTSMRPKESYVCIKDYAGSPERKHKAKFVATMQSTFGNTEHKRILCNI